MYKSSSTGPFTIPTAPQAGVSIVGGVANTYTASYVQLIASTAEAEYITGVQVSGVVVTPTYCNVQLATGAAAAETIVGQIQLAPCQIGTKFSAFVPVWPWIPVATGTRIAAKIATDVASLTVLVTLQCMKQSLVVVDSNVKEQVDVQTWLTTAVTAATAGIPDVNTKNINNVAAATPGAANGILISGSNAGTTTLGALTITGATTHTGATVHTGNVSLADGLTIAAPSTGNRAGLDIAGNGTGAAFKLTAGATGIGMSVAGGATSGDGIKVTTTSGHGVNLAPVGSSMHGLLSTGGNGGTSDGIKAAAGTGGVDLRAAITGNLTGNVSGSVGSVTGAVGSVTARVTANTDQLAGQTVTAAAGVTFPSSVASPTNITAGTITTVTTLTNLPSIPANWITAAGITAAALNGKGDWLLASSYTAPTNLTAAQIATGVWQDTTAGDFTTAASVGKSVMNGVALGTGLTVAAVSGAVGSVTGNVGGNVTGSVGSVVGAVGSVTGAVGSVTGNVGGNVVGSVASVTAPVALTAAYDLAKTAAQAGDAMTLTAAYNAAKTAAQAGDAMALTAAYDAAKTAITTGGVLTEDYRANGAAGTFPQIAYELLAHLGESSIAGTTKTINKLDHVTAAETFTLDDAATPTSITRST